MNIIKNIIRNNFEHFAFFYIQLRQRLFIALVLSIIVGALDGFGLAMFLPLLEMVDGERTATADGLGNLAFLINGLQAIGINLNLSTVLFTMLFFFSLKGIAKFYETYYKVITQQYFIKKLRLDNINRLSNYKYKAFVVSDAGRIQNTLSGETERVVSAYKFYFMAMQATVMLIVYVILALMANTQFAILVSIGGALSNIAFKQIYKRTKDVSRKITRDSHGYQGLLIQKVAFFKYLKATALNSLFAEKLKTAVKEIERSNRKIGYYGAILGAVREPIVVSVVIGVILIQVTYFETSLGLIILSLLFFYRALTFLMALQTHWNNFLNVSGSLENMTIFQKEMNRDQEIFGKVKLNNFRHEIQICNLEFKYGDAIILKDVNLSLIKNKTYAFVGESGSGKTTLVNLIAGLMPPDQGEILIDNQNARELDITSYQSRIGYITQEAVIFNDTIFNNVTFWAHPSPENISRFWEALKKAAIIDYVKGLPNQEKELLGNNGINVSGGQKQRLSIARELFKEIDILVMDEATSALDSETEKVIQNNIDQLKGQYTILIVAHRLSTIRNADQVILMDKGKIASIGTFTQLIEQSKGFKKMIELQEI